MAMTLETIARELGWENLTPDVAGLGTREITRAYVSDMLSDVLANAPRGGVLITIQTHMNTLAVAVHAEQAAVIFAMNRRPDESVARKAAEEGLGLYVSSARAFDVAGRLFMAGVRGQDG
jgi:hypothetical protein